RLVLDEVQPGANCGGRVGDQGLAVGRVEAHRHIDVAELVDRRAAVGLGQNVERGYVEDVVGVVVVDPRAEGVEQHPLDQVLDFVGALGGRVEGEQEVAYRGEDGVAEIADELPRLPQPVADQGQVVDRVALQSFLEYLEQLVDAGDDRAQVELDAAEVELGQRDVQSVEVGDVGQGDLQRRVAALDRDARGDVELGLEAALGRLELDAVHELRELNAAVVVDIAGGVGQREGQRNRVIDGGVAGVAVENKDTAGQP